MNIRRVSSALLPLSPFLVGDLSFFFSLIPHLLAVASSVESNFSPFVTEAAVESQEGSMANCLDLIEPKVKLLWHRIVALFTCSIHACAVMDYFLTKIFPCVFLQWQSL